MNVLKKWMADGAEVSIKRFSADDEVDPKLAELFKSVSTAESFEEFRMMLNHYFPQLNDGTIITVDEFINSGLADRPHGH